MTEIDTTTTTSDPPWETFNSQCFHRYMKQSIQLGTTMSENETTDGDLIVLTNNVHHLPLQERRRQVQRGTDTFKKTELRDSPQPQMVEGALLSPFRNPCSPTAAIIDMDKSDLYYHLESSEGTSTESIDTEDEDSDRDGLPFLLEITPMERLPVLARKIERCRASNDRAIFTRIARKHILEEISEFLATRAGRECFSHVHIQHLLVDMISSHILMQRSRSKRFRLETSQRSEMDLVYKLLFQIATSRRLQTLAKPGLLPKQLCSGLVDLIDSDSKEERDSLRYILYRIYKDYSQYRTHFKRIIADVLLRHVYEEQDHRGINELLMMYSCVIKGLQVPLRPSNVEFLAEILVPLHRVKNVAPFHEELVECMVEYCRKDERLLSIVIREMMRVWPWRNSTKQLLFIDELETLMEMMQQDQLDELKDEFFPFFGCLLKSDHYQVLEKALSFWKNLSFVESGYFGAVYSKELLPNIYSPLLKAFDHWHRDVSNLAKFVLKIYQMMATDTFERCQEAEIADAEMQDQIAAAWENLEVLADLNMALLRQEAEEI